MSSISPIISAAEINDLKTRLASLEAALGRYNAASTVLAASNLQATAGGSTTSTGGQEQMSPINTNIIKGYAPATALTTRSGYQIANVEINYSSAGYAKAPAVIVTPVVVDKNDFAIAASVSLKSATTTGVTGKLYIPVPSASGYKVVGCTYVAIGM